MVKVEWEPLPVGWYYVTHDEGCSWYVRSRGKLSYDGRTQADTYLLTSRVGRDGYVSPNLSKWCINCQHSVGQDGKWHVEPINQPPDEILEAYVREQLKEALDGTSV